MEISVIKGKGEIINITHSVFNWERDKPFEFRSQREKSKQNDIMRIHGIYAHKAPEYDKVARVMFVAVWWEQYFEREKSISVIFIQL